MNKQQEWTVYTLGAANLMATSLLGKHVVGSLHWEMVFWVCSGAALFALVVMVSVTHGYEPIAKYAYNETEDLDHE